MQFVDYQAAFKTARLERSPDGVLTITLHSRGETLWWGALPHRELADLFAAVATDSDNRVVMVTGTGDEFITLPDGGVGALAAGGVTATEWDTIIREGNRLVTNLLDVEVPMIAAVNGPVAVHSELAVLCDIVLCTPDVSFQARAPTTAGDGRRPPHGARARGHRLDCSRRRGPTRRAGNASERSCVRRSLAP